MTTTALENRAIQRELDNDSDIKCVSLKDGLSANHPLMLAAIKVFDLGGLGPTGWEPEITDQDSLVFDDSLPPSFSPYVLALCTDTLMWHLLKLCNGDENLMWFEDPDGRKHTRDNYHEWLPVSHILRDVRRDS